MQGRRVAIVAVAAVVVVGSAAVVTNRSSGPEGRPSVEVRDDDTKLTVSAVSWSGGSYVADGLPPRPLPDLGVVGGLVTISFPRSGWTFSATQVHPPNADHFSCAERLPANLSRVDENTWRLSPAGPADRYAVQLRGHDPHGAAASFDFAMTTRQRGHMPAPTAWAQVFTKRGGGAPKMPGSVVLTLQHLAATPDEAAATLTVRGSEGQVVTYRLTPAKQDCWARGTAYLRTRSPKIDVTRKLGTPPYHLRWVLRLDGKRHVAQAVWPKDERGVDSLIHPKFTPSLPAWSPTK